MAKAPIEKGGWEHGPRAKIKRLLRQTAQEATNRGSTLISHSKALDAGRTGHPLAPGRTFTVSAAGTLSAGDAPSLVLGVSVTLSVHRAMQFLCFIILTGFRRRVKKIFPHHAAPAVSQKQIEQKQIL